MSEPTKVNNLTSTFTVLDEGTGAIPVPVTTDLYERLDRDFDGFKGKRLVAIHDFQSDWPSWEIHPAGEELVCLISGRVTLILETPSGETECRLEQPGDYLVVPTDTWHTARTSTGCQMLFITPGEGTLNREI